jgi:hypothetical protein
MELGAPNAIGRMQLRAVPHIGVTDLMNETLFIHRRRSRSPILHALRPMLKNEHLVFTKHFITIFIQFDMGVDAVHFVRKLLFGNPGVTGLLCEVAMANFCCQQETDC